MAGGLRRPQAETVVMLRREDHRAEPARASGACPLPRVEVRRRKDPRILAPVATLTVRERVHAKVHEQRQPVALPFELSAGGRGARGCEPGGERGGRRRDETPARENHVRPTIPSDVTMQLKVKRLSGGAVLPSYSHAGDAGLDLFAAVNLVLPPGEAALIKTGIAIELPPGTEAQVRPRSGLALEHAVTVLNTPGTIDEGYRGEVGVILINHGRTMFTVTTGMKVAQLVIASRLTVDV